MQLCNRARDYTLVYHIDFENMESLRLHTDIDVGYDFDVPSSEGSGRVWIVEHRPTGAMFMVSYYDEEDMEDTAKWLDTRAIPEESPYALLTFAILNEDYD